MNDLKVEIEVDTDEDDKKTRRGEAPHIFTYTSRFCSCLLGLCTFPFCWVFGLLSCPFVSFVSFRSFLLCFYGQEFIFGIIDPGPAGSRFGFLFVLVGRGSSPSSFFSYVVLVYIAMPSPVLEIINEEKRPSAHQQTTSEPHSFFPFR